CGIGWIVASQLLARIGDWRELKNVRPLAGVLGLVPSERSTAEKPIGERSPILETAGWEANSSKPPRPRSPRTGNFENFFAPFAAAIPVALVRGWPLWRWPVS